MDGSIKTVEKKVIVYEVNGKTYTTKSEAEKVIKKLKKKSFENKLLEIILNRYLNSSEYKEQKGEKKLQESYEQYLEETDQDIGENSFRDYEAYLDTETMDELEWIYSIDSPKEFTNVIIGILEFLGKKDFKKLLKELSDAV
jgi:hypothetical protein